MSSNADTKLSHCGMNLDHRKDFPTESVFVTALGTGSRCGEAGDQVWPENVSTCLEGGPPQGRVGDFLGLPLLLHCWCW